ncbi:SRPBCC family protein [Fulvimonas soli]|uniref:Polyketide cyclase/dehydrase/lipid transport protein n=1 Tax=Fulvimonas soli TaxID=155197 RepID=A0A316IP45_9GAMM|nr:SRPBCC family protein [Fulvimonas soli]PWK92308.1 polyketide cyclase/dehydrase/lipid transport protein [Fulvimonas soli]TNY25190.1 hypothetical protein BV497_15185 [Fulvimonas soli]
MPVFRHQVTIAAAPERVWRVLAEIERWPEWTPTMLRVEPLRPGPLEAGAQVRIAQPRLRPAVWTVTDWRPRQGFVWVSRGPGVRVVAGHWIEPSPQGAAVTLEARFEGPLGILAGWLGGAPTRSYLATEAAGLKRRCEDAAPARAST